MQTVVGIFLCLLLLNCEEPAAATQSTRGTPQQPDTACPYPIPGSYNTPAYINDLLGKNVAVTANHTAKIAGIHLVDTLLRRGIAVKKVFAPEHGFRGMADAGDKVNTYTDARTGLPIVSLYGKNKKPSAEQLSNIDVVIVDIQDVGVRFYTYISTLTYVMEACAENGKPLIVLDRPNPNGHYIDGPVLNADFTSFVGMHSVPVVYGLTIGEYAKMVNGEKWLKGGATCDLRVVPCANYSHKTAYELPIKPSPNLPNTRSVLLYPSLCFFEGTVVSAGRGTAHPFQLYGHPHYPSGMFSFVPEAMPGAKYPKHQGKKCYGTFLGDVSVSTLYEQGFTLSYLLATYAVLGNNEESFFNPDFFDKLAGSDRLRKQIIAGMSEVAIRATWQDELNEYKKIRNKYLLYDDF